MQRVRQQQVILDFLHHAFEGISYVNLNPTSRHVCLEKFPVLKNILTLLYIDKFDALPEDKIYVWIHESESTRKFLLLDEETHMSLSNLGLCDIGE